MVRLVVPQDRLGHVRQRPRRRAFSLLELVVVITILGVVAAIAIPRMGLVSRGARQAATRASLFGLQQAIDHYAAEHGGRLPASTEDGLGNAAGSSNAFRNQLVYYTDARGSVSIALDRGKYPFGPYLREIPPLPLGQNEGSTAVWVQTTGPTPDPSRAAGWVYNVKTGIIIPNLSAGTASDEGLTDVTDVGGG